MGDRNVEYSNKFGIGTFKNEIVNELGVEVWQELVKDNDIPDIDTEASCKCKNMAIFMERFDKVIDEQMAKKILSRVRHGLKPSQCA